MSASPQHAYRPDIDGMRAIAVSSVVAYHAAESILPGGFIGVDVFFVISGFLITQLLARDLRDGRFSLARFYLRRSARLLPALTASLVGTLLLSAIVMTPNELVRLGRGTAATFGFVSNILLWQEVDYFSPASDRNPLLHTWSLAVEEQFYLLWPLTLALLWRIGRIPSIVAIGLGLTFLASCVLVRLDAGAAFFLLPARAWELLAGALLAFLVPRVALGRTTGAVLACGGLVVIAIGLTTLDRQSVFPGANALWPCVGAACLIVAGSRSSNVVSERLLAHPVLVFVGLISYSLYLWHWPLLALVRLTRHGQPTGWQVVSAVLAAVVLSVASWRWIERPFRAAAATSVRGSLLKYGAVSVSGVALGLAIVHADGLSRFARPDVERIEAAKRDTNPLLGTCLRLQGNGGPLPGPECVVGAAVDAPSVVVWGDSHAAALAPGIVERETTRGRTVQQLTMIACPPLWGAEVVSERSPYRNCTDFNTRAIEQVVGDPRIDTVYLAARWTLYAGNVRFGPDDTGPATYLADPRDAERSAESSTRVLESALDRTVTRLEGAGKRVMLIGSVPPIGVNVPSCLARNLMPWSSVSDCSVDRATMSARLDTVDRSLEEIGERHESTCTYLPVRDLCREDRCLVQHDGAILYADDDHLTVHGAQFVLRHLNCSAGESARSSDQGGSP